MKSKALVLLSTLVMALALMAQSAPQSSTPNPDTANSCASCNHGNTQAKAECCGKGAKCCTDGAECCKGKDGKMCPMMSKDSGGKMSCCSGDKCPMMSKKDGKGCCGGKMCARPQTGA